MSLRLKRNLPLLRRLVGSTAKERKAILGRCSSDLILALCEIALNLLKGRIPLTLNQLKKLRRQKTAIKLFANKRASLQKKRHSIQQSGGFLLPLLSIAVPFITSLIAARRGG
jgi:hypothetical protein